MNKCEISVNGSTSDFQSEGDDSNSSFRSKIWMVIASGGAPSLENYGRGEISLRLSSSCHPPQ